MAKSRKTERGTRSNQDIPEALVNEQKAEQALQDAKKRTRHC
ncbi:MAG: hypothetical protein ACOX4H_10860 [Bacillota bacterium]